MYQPTIEANIVAFCMYIVQRMYYNIAHGAMLPLLGDELKQIRFVITLNSHKFLLASMWMEDNRNMDAPKT